MSNRIVRKIVTQGALVAASGVLVAGCATTAAPAPDRDLSSAKGPGHTVGQTETSPSRYSNLARVGVYNPAAGKVEYRDGKYSGLDLAGVYNPKTQAVEWRDAKYSGLQVAGVYNEASEQVEWRDGK